MQSKTIGKIIVDLGMTVLLMLLMAFELIGRTAHEWSKNLFHGKYSAYRFLQTISAGLVFLTMLGSMVSAVLISREVFAFLPISGGRSSCRMSSFSGMDRTN